MFDVDSSQYKENIETKIKELKEAVSYGRELMDRHMCGSDQVFVLLVSEDWEVNYDTLHFLKAYQRRNKTQKFILLSSDENMRKLAEEACNVPYTFVLCSKWDLVSLEKLYNIFGIEKLFIVNSFQHSADKDCFRLEDGESITKADIVAQMILQLPQVPAEEELRGEMDPPGNEIGQQQYRATRLPWREGLGMLPHIPESMVGNALAGLDAVVRNALVFLMEGKKIGPEHRIALFGVTKTAQCAAKILENYNIEAYLDNDIKKVGHMLEGIPVRLPEDMPQGNNPYLVILICTRRYAEALAQLMELGYEPNKNMFIIYSVPIGKDLSEESEKYLLETKILEGKKVYEEIRRKYLEETMMIRPYTGTGDIYLLGGYFHYLEQRFPAKNAILIVPRMGEAKVAKMFGIEALSYAPEDLQRLLFFVRTVGVETLNAFSFNMNLDQVRVCTSNIHKKMDLHTMYQKLVFEKESKVVSFPMYQGNADLIFKKYNLEKGRTVLMSPYATNTKSFSIDTWGRIAAAIIKRGYSVCTNIAENEQGIEGTKEIFIPYDKVLDFVNKAGIFIALRSGLCDIVSSTTADMIVFYPTNTPAGEGVYYNNFSLERMELRKDHLMEIKYVDDLTEQQICLILEFFDGRKAKYV